jgi:hypothetical protein
VKSTSLQRARSIPFPIWLCLPLALVAPSVVRSQDPPTAGGEATTKSADDGKTSPPVLPWEKLPPRISEPILRPPANAREILQRYDIGPSQLDGFFHGQPLGPGEDDLLAKMLYRFPRLGLDNLERWRRKDVTWDQLAAAPNDYRAEVFHLRGRATRVEEHKLLPELAELFEFDKYFQVTLAIDDSPYRALICTRNVPTAWKVGEPLDERAAADGLFLKLGATEDGATAPQLVFAAGRVAWLPDRAEPAAHVGPDQLKLAEWGFDIGLFDGVRAANGRGIGDADREAFYQLLAALGRAPAGAFQRSPASINLVALLERPQEHHGQFLSVQGIARRVTKVQVSDQDVQRRFGIDHYYEIDMSLPLGDKTLRFGKDPKGEENPVYANSFPVTLNVLRLPPDLTEGDNQNTTVRADAVFFKLWTYRAVYTSKFNRVQPAPLLFAVEPALVPFERGSNVVSGVLVAGAFLLAGIVIGVIFWWYRGSDLDAERRRTAASEDRPAPDFSGMK